MLKGVKVLLGVCGSIAAYKAAMLTRLLVKQGAEVQVLMTSAAQDFITPLTLATLSKKPALSQYFTAANGVWNNHVDLGLWADLMVVAPLSANTLAKMAHGQSNNLLTATYLSARCPVFVAPAMDLDMYAHPATQRNLALLQEYGNHIIEAEHGELASGLQGQGRMAEPEHIVAALEKYWQNHGTPAAHPPNAGPLSGQQVLVTAGPTHEAIDPVRFIGNHSSGKMGFALAHELAQLGAQVHLVCGPTHQQSNHPNITRVDVTSAQQMHAACMALWPKINVAVLAAAVADYTPKEPANQKIKKKETALNIELVKTHDIAAELGKRKGPRQFMVGFALETQDEHQNAVEKIKKKNFDIIVLNSLNDPGAGFKHNTNKVTIIDRQGQSTPYPLKSKDQVAKDIVHEILQRLPAAV